MENNICLYEIQRAPYVAVSSVFRTSGERCLIEDTSGKLKKVKPIYIGPFDYIKLHQFGEVFLSYFKKNSNTTMQDVHDRANEIFKYRVGTND